MPDIKKPAFPAIPAAALTSKIDDVRNAVANATTQGPDGRKTVDVAKLEAVANGSQDPALRRALSAIVDSFTTYRESNRVSGACGGPIRERVVPPSLSEAQLTEVSRALDQAKNKLKLQTGADGVLQEVESKDVRFGTGLAADIGEAVMEGARAPWEDSLRTWANKVAETAYKVSARQDVDGGIERLADRHGQTAAGKDAIRWAFRAMAASPGELFRYADAEKKLQKAETSWLTRVPFFGNGVENAAGHLSDTEVKKMLGTSDLEAFVKIKKGEIEQRFPGGWDAFVAGKDLPNYADVNDPAVVRSRC